MEQFVKKSYVIQAVRVTSENLEDLSVQYGGVIKNSGIYGAPGDQRYIELVAKRYGLNKRVMVFVGDWLAILGGETIRTYGHRAFKSSFAPAKKDKHAALVDVLATYAYSVEQDGWSGEEFKTTVDKIEKLFRTPEAGE
jgi:hypothetical protein